MTLRSRGSALAWRPAPLPRRLRVCHVMSADLWAGAEVQVATVAAYLAGRPDLDVRAVLFNEGGLAAELRRLGLPVTVIDERRRSAPAILFSLARWLRENPVDVLHTHRYKDTLLGALAARAAGGPALVRTVHGLSEPMQGWDAAKFRVYEALERWALRGFADRIVAVSGAMSDRLAAVYGAGTVVTIPNGVDLRRVRPARAREDVRRELGVRAADPLIGTAGRLAPVKAQADLLRAAALVLARHPQARLLLVGDGPLRNDLERLAAALGIARACLFTGPRADVFDLMAAMDVFVLPSLDEGMPMGLLEAMALGVPAVATAVGGVPEVLAHRTCGLLVAPREPRALAEACLELLRDPAWARQLAARGRNRVEEAFGLDRQGEALVAAYQALASGRPVGGPPARLRLAPPVGRSAPAPGPAWRRTGALVGWTARRLRRAAAGALARRRLDRARRDPRALAAALRSAKRILVLCHGNIIRSPFTARLVARELGRGAPVSVSSAGLAAKPGTRPPAAAFHAAAGLNVDLAGHRASALTADAVAASDVIFVMEVAQLEAVRRRFPQAAGKSYLLTALAPGSALEVRDPFGGSEAAFRACFRHIRASVRPIVRALAARDDGR